MSASVLKDTGTLDVRFLGKTVLVLVPQISPWINVGGGFVHHDDFVLPEHGAGQADQLALAG